LKRKTGRARLWHLKRQRLGWH